MILLFQVLSSKHFAPTAHIFVPTELLVRGPGQHRQWPGLAQMVQGRPAPSLGSQQLTRSLETGREIWEERERDYAVACKLGDVGDGRQDKTIPGQARHNVTSSTHWAVQ